MVTFKSKISVVLSQFCSLAWKRVFRRKKLFCVIFCVTFVLSLLKLVSRAFSFSCSYQEIEAAIGLICKNYNNRDAIGSACADMCDSGFLQTCSCLPHHLGKDVVFIAHYKGEKVVVKSSKLNTDNLDQVFWMTSNGSIGYPDLEIFHSMMKDNLHRNLNIRLDVWNGSENHLINKLWHNNLQPLSELPQNELNIAENNIWYLMQQNEYLFLKYHEDKNIFPKIMGTCGHFYIVEHIHLLDNLFMVLYPTWRSAFPLRAALALKLLDYIESVTSDFPDLHICDMKMGHFGEDSYGNIKFLDVDMVFFKPSLIQNIVAIDECDQDKDCCFIDCQASCDRNQRKCEPRVLDTNFQRVCINIFSGQYFGLLSFPPYDIKDKLNDILHRCSKEFHNASMQEIISSELRILLQSVIK